MLARVNRLTQATNRPPAWICKYYQAVLSTKVLHSSSRSEICFRGKPNKMVVRKSFEVFLDLYVYCENCGKHDTPLHTTFHVRGFTVYPVLGVITRQLTVRQARRPLAPPNSGVVTTRVRCQLPWTLVSCPGTLRNASSPEEASSHEHTRTRSFWH